MTTTAVPTEPRRTAGRVVVGAGVSGVVALVVGLLVTGGAGPQPYGDPGSLVRWGLPVLTLLWQFAAATAVGLSGLATFLMPERGSTNRRALAMRYASWSALVWAVAGGLTTLFTFADLVGESPLSGEVFAQFRSFIFVLDYTRILAISALIGLGIAVVARFATARSTMTWLTLIGLFAVGLNALTGHAGNAEGHEEAVNAMGFHLLGVTVWVGGLIALAIMRPHLLDPGEGADLAASVERYSVLALWSYVFVALSGIQSTWIRIGSLDNLFTTYGLLASLKAGLLVLLGLAGWQQRRAVVRSLRESPASRRLFARLASVETLLMLAAIGLGVALSRSEPPGVREIPPADMVNTLTGYPDPGPISAADYLLTWRIDWLFLTIAVLAIGLYLAGVMRLLRRGDRWPVGRTVVWIIGWLVFVYATCGALGIWGRVLFSTHMIMHMLIAMFVPLLLVPGAPVTLALRALKARRDKTWGPRELILQLTHSRVNRALTNPVVAAVLFFASMAIFYYSRTFHLALTTHTGHLLMMAHFFLTGYLFTWVLIGIDPGPRKWPPLMLLVILFVTISFHAFFGVILTGTEYLLAPDFYGQLNLPWLPDPWLDQYRAGEIAWGVGEIPTLILALMVARNWARQDKAETKRKDRQARRDGDAELAAYNEWLAERRRARDRMGG